VQAAKGGQVVKQELVTIERGGRQVVRVALEPSVTLPASRGLGFSLGDDQEQPSDSRAKTTDAVDAILLNPQGAQACWVRALTLFHEGDFEEGIAQLDEAIRLDRQPKHYWRRGIAYRDLGMFDRSLADLNELFRTPEYRGGDYYTERGLTCLLKGDLDRAIADSAEMILLRPTAPEGYLIRAGTHWVKRDFDRALADCDKAVELLKHRNCYYYRAECCRDKGDFPRALSDLSEVIRLEPTYAEGYRKRALVRIQLGQFNEASDDVAQAIELSRQNGLGKHQMAWFLATTEEPRLRDVERAVQLASEAVSVSPSSILLQNTLGAAQYRAGNWKAALAAFEKAERLRGLLGAGGWFFRAMTHWQLGQQDQARASYDEAVKRAAEVHFLDQDLHRFRVEAAELLGIPEKPPTAKEEPGKSK
jgi:tetratricopeptide (TPR) repeat protein